MSSSTPVSAKSINPLLAKYIASLATRPLLTKAVTAGVLNFLQDIAGNHLAGVPVQTSKDAPIHTRALAAAKIDIRSFKLALYGFGVSAPLTHFLVGRLQKAFEGNTAPTARLQQLFLQNILIAPIQTVAYLAALAIIGGAKSKEGVLALIKVGFWRMLRVTWTISPLAVAFAQRFLPPHQWVVFFPLVGFSAGVTFSAAVKKQKVRAIAAARAKAEREAKQAPGEA